ncbi:hypothetical protein NIES2101_39490 [Calothrix sp. HK-06]|nr:hypothetical protein NIES2101_39490 [Calothrix sp. HK-06]
MTELLRRAIAEIEQLPNDQQDAIATRLLAELQDEKSWTSKFEATTNGQWDKLAAMVRQDIAAGETLPLDELFPPK